MASLVNNLTQKLTILTQGMHDFKPEQIHKFKKQGIEIEEKEIAAIEHQNGYLQKVILKDGSHLELDAMYANVAFTQASDIPITLGVELTKQGHIAVDGLQKTKISGIYACGDNASGMRSIANAIASGNLAGTMTNMDLSNENF